MSKIVKQANALMIVVLVLMFSGPLALAEPLIGRVSATLGDVRINGKNGARKAAVAEALYNGESVTTGAADAASLLLASNVVIKLDGNTELRVVESHGGEKLVPGGAVAGNDAPITHLELGKG